jgi:hypothetical protein
MLKIVVHCSKLMIKFGKFGFYGGAVESLTCVEGEIALNDL